MRCLSRHCNRMVVPLLLCLNPSRRLRRECASHQGRSGTAWWRVHPMIVIVCASMYRRRGFGAKSAPGASAALPPARRREVSAPTVAPSPQNEQGAAGNSVTKRPHIVAGTDAPSAAFNRTDGCTAKLAAASPDAAAPDMPTRVKSSDANCPPEAADPGLNLAITKASPEHAGTNTPTTLAAPDAFAATETSPSAVAHPRQQSRVDKPDTVLACDMSPQPLADTAGLEAGAKGTAAAALEANARRKRRQPVLDDAFAVSPSCVRRRTEAGALAQPPAGEQLDVTALAADVDPTGDQQVGCGDDATPPLSATPSAHSPGEAGDAALAALPAGSPLRPQTQAVPLCAAAACDDVAVTPQVRQHDGEEADDGWQQHSGAGFVDGCELRASQRSWQRSMSQRRMGSASGGHARSADPLLAQELCSASRSLGSAGSLPEPLVLPQADGRGGAEAAVSPALGDVLPRQAEGALAAVAPPLVAGASAHAAGSPRLSAPATDVQLLDAAAAATPQAAYEPAHSEPGANVCEPDLASLEAWLGPDRSQVQVCSTLPLLDHVADTAVRRCTHTIFAQVEHLRMLMRYRLVPLCTGKMGGLATRARATHVAARGCSPARARCRDAPRPSAAAEHSSDARSTRPLAPRCSGCCASHSG